KFDTAFQVSVSGLCQACTKRMPEISEARNFFRRNLKKAENDAYRLTLRGGKIDHLCGAHAVSCRLAGYSRYRCITNSLYPCIREPFFFFALIFWELPLSHDSTLDVSFSAIMTKST